MKDLWKRLEKKWKIFDEETARCSPYEIFVGYTVGMLEGAGTIFVPWYILDYFGVT